MTGLALGLLLQTAFLAAGAQPYEKAAEEAQAKGQPLLVLVGAEWCPGCVTMKNGVLSQMTRTGQLKRVSYAAVDADEHQELAGRLMRGNSIPQLIVFSKKADGQWHREQVVGAVGEAEVESLIDRAIAQQARPDGSAADMARK